MPEISIVIPAYNAEKYIDDCLKSISKQSFTDFEVIIVNDGSVDNTRLICEKYVSMDSRYHLFNIANGGVSRARNWALDYVRGKWITFVDADDWIEFNLLECLYNQVTDKIDIVMGNMFFNIGNKEKIGRCSKAIIRKTEFTSYPLALMVQDCSRINDFAISVEILCAACGKLVRKELIDKFHLRFAENLSLNEDGLFFLRSYLKAVDVVIIKKPLYHYRMSLESSNYRYRPDVHNQMMVWHQQFSAVAQDIPQSMREYFLSLSSYRMYGNLMSLFIDNPKNKVSFWEKRKQLKHFLQSGIYDISLINPNVVIVKYIEMFALKQHWCIMLLLIFKFKKYLKSVL